MKLKHRIGAIFGALALAVAMVLAPLSAIGATPSDPTIMVSGLDSGDTAVAYQVIQQNADTREWEFTSTFAGAKLEDGTEITIAMVLDGLTPEEAGALAAKASGTTIPMTVSEGTATAGTTESPVAPGMYYVLVTPADNATIYAPIFVSADYKGTSASSIDASTATLPATGSEVIAKKSTLTLDKKSNGSTLENEASASDTSVAVGSIIDFEVDTNVPSYTDNVTDPTFIVSDSVSTGLEIQTGTVSVKVGSATAQTVAAGGYYNADGTVGTSSAYDYKVSALTTDGWTIEFSESYLTAAKGAQNPPVVVTYKAKVTSEAPMSVNELTNKATVEFTHTPDGDINYLVDQTNHYTYDFDMPLAGKTPGANSDEFVKVGVDSEGNPIITNKTRVIAEETYGPLEGAQFELRDSTGQTVIATATTDADGHMAFRGLDAGTYQLVETQAPAGFTFDPTPHTVIITPTYETKTIPVQVTATETQNIPVRVVTGYTVTCDGTTVGNYTLQNWGTDDFSANKPDTDIPAIFENVRQTPELPTTGGAGTLALTVGGVILIVAGIALVMRVARKSN